MTPDELRQLTSEPESASLAALWLDDRGDWEGAHRMVQTETSTATAWVHAYLHRKEGDLSNARYWYDLAKKPEFTGSLESEWSELVAALS